MTFKTKSILNYTVSVLFIVLTIAHICEGKTILRIYCDIIPALWFGIVATVFIVKHYKNR